MQIESCGDANLLQKWFMDNIDLLVDGGFNKPVSKCGLDDRVTIVQSACLQMVILNTLAELHQYMDGLASVSVREAIQNNSSLLKSFFLLNKQDRVNSRYTSRVSFRNFSLREGGGE